MRHDRFVHASGVDIRVETFGDPVDPAILLIGGPGGSMYWAKEFCERLAAGLRFVIRYDSPDIRRSISSESGAAPDATAELAGDAAALLDALAVGDVHIVGVSTGGPIAQRLAHDHARRVDSITLVSTSPGDYGWAGSGGITAPTLVIHGTEDAFHQVGALANEIPGARLLPIEGVGLQMPPRSAWDVIVPAILSHTSGGWEAQEDRLASRSLAAGDPTGWFDRLYSAGAAGEVPMPWDRVQPHPLLSQWAQARRLTGTGRRAVVVGCGLGADAEFTARRGFKTVAFDVAETAVRLARRRFPDSKVHYVAADLLDPPSEWLRTFDLVVEIITVQALPDPHRHKAIVNVGRLVGPDGTLIAIAAVHEESGVPGQAAPWPLTRTEIEAFATDGLTPVRIEEVTDPRRSNEHRWRAEFHRPR